VSSPAFDGVVGRDAELDLIDAALALRNEPARE
jgi:hypothetical protein